MEAEVYRRFLAHRKKCLAVSIARLQKWSHEVMKELHPGEKWAGSQRWAQRFRRRWNLTTRAKTRVGQKLSSSELLFGGIVDCETEVKNFWTYVRHSRRQYKIDLPWILNADQTPLWLEMPSERTVEEVGSCSVPVCSGGYQ
ncbi:unnamed protein product [Closterium sp. NIES-53]